jgi:hypothetical protein
MLSGFLLTADNACGNTGRFEFFLHRLIILRMVYRREQAVVRAVNFLVGFSERDIPVQQARTQRLASRHNSIPQPAEIATISWTAPGFLLCGLQVVSVTGVIGLDVGVEKKRPSVCITVSHGNHGRSPDER